MNIKNGLKAAGVYVSVVIGAGFASGKEILTFFAAHGAYGVFSVILAGAILSVAGWAVLDICAREKISDGGVFLRTVMGRRLGAGMEFVVGLFLCVMFFAMMAGVGEVSEEALGLPFTPSVVAVAAITFAVLTFGTGGVINVNKILAPILIIGGLSLGLWAIIFLRGDAGVPAGAPDFKPIGGGIFLFSGAAYASYNILTAVMVLANLPDINKDRETAKAGGLLGGAALGALGLVFTAALSANYAAVAGYDIPMLALAGKIGVWAKYFYIAVIYAAIFTTAVSNAFAASRWLAVSLGIKKVYADSIICAGGVLGAHLGFSILVGDVYAFFGLLGLIEVFAIIKYFLRGSVTYGKQRLKFHNRP